MALVACSLTRDNTVLAPLLFGNWSEEWRIFGKDQRLCHSMTDAYYKQWQSFIKWLKSWCMSRSFITGAMLTQELRCWDCYMLLVLLDSKTMLKSSQFQMTQRFVKNMLFCHLNPINSYSVKHNLYNTRVWF